MSEELADNQALLQKSWVDLKKEIKVCNEVKHPTYDSINLLIVLIYALFQYLVQIVRMWYQQLFKWFRYVVPSLPYVSSRL